jgi:hypothetical protein
VSSADRTVVDNVLSGQVQKLIADLKEADKRAKYLYDALAAADKEMRLGQMNAGWRIVREALKGGVCD